VETAGDYTSQKKGVGLCYSSLFDSKIPLIINSVLRYVENSGGYVQTGEMTIEYAIEKKLYRVNKSQYVNASSYKASKAKTFICK